MTTTTEAIRLALGYMKHTPLCAVTGGYEQPCNCGRDAAAAALASLQAQESGKDVPPDFGHKRFVCPECGSGRWGTSNLNLPEDKWIGHCHGQGCKFTWMRKDDDKVFVGDAASSQQGDSKPLEQEPEDLKPIIELFKLDLTDLYTKTFARLDYWMLRALKAEGKIK